MSGQTQTYEPVRIDTSKPVEVEREALFYIDDDEFTIPKTIPANITIKYLRDCADHGQEVALGRAMKVVLGEEAMEALAESDSVSEDDMAGIMRIVERKLQGQMKRSLGKSRNGRPR